MVKALLFVACGITSVTDQDSLVHKRFESTGTLIAEIFRTSFKRFIRSLTTHLVNRQDIQSLVLNPKTNTITKDMLYCFSTGSWNAQVHAFAKQGISQLLCRQSYNATLSHLRRFMSSIGKEAKHQSARMIHTSQAFFICPIETPEGHAVGIVGNFTNMTIISNPILTHQFIPYLFTFAKDLGHLHEHEPNTVPIFVNFRTVGYTRDCTRYVDILRLMRRKCLIPKDVSIYVDRSQNEIHISTEYGRLLRPLCVIDKKTLTVPAYIHVDMSITEMECKKYIEWIDMIEIEQYLVAMTVDKVTSDKYDYCEIHPTAMFGLCASIIPFADHNQSARNTFQAAMGKQSIGIYSSMYANRFDTTARVMIQSQKPLVSTHTAEQLNVHDIPAGVNAMVAICNFTGYNQEDSIILNKSSVDRGLFVSVNYSTVTIEEKKGSTSYIEQICMPDEHVRQKSLNYSKLDQHTGIIRPGEWVDEGDVIIGRISIKISKTAQMEIEKTQKDMSVSVKKNEQGRIDRVIKTWDVDGSVIYKVKIRQIRVPEMGDKFCSRSAQKGTCGMLFKQEDMPFTLDGSVPDIILNPHAIPSRMTVNHLLECVLGTAQCLEAGKRGQGLSTAFSSYSKHISEELCERLKDAGMDDRGKVDMYNPFTGEKWKARIFYGPTYYQKLKHMVYDKMHSRARGNVQSLTRQPLEGRSRDGGLRIGEMERDCMISHGVSTFLRERLFDLSDAHSVTVCKACGNITSTSEKCHACQSSDIESVAIPYAMKVLQSEIQAMGIAVNIF